MREGEREREHEQAQKHLDRGARPPPGLQSKTTPSPEARRRLWVTLGVNLRVGGL